MSPIEIIIKKRDKKELSKEEIEFVVSGYAKDEIPDYQISAFLMAVFLNGMSGRETADLTLAMARSGKCLDLSPVGFTVDKHSTGGVGDKTKLIVVPVTASAGLKVPTMFGRGLGHTGGTRDKLESIPGFRTILAKKEILSQLSKIGAVMIGATEEIAPADKKIYALRDVTGSVESIPLITSSILSKKIAEGADAFVMDVKTGSGAFMKREKDAEKLAHLLVSTSGLMGKKCAAVISDMSQPLGYAVGNSLEVREAIETLRGKGPKDLVSLSLTLAAHMLVLGKKAKDFNKGFRIAENNLSNGGAYRKFVEIVESQGGDVSFIENPGLFPKAKIIKTIPAQRSGWMSTMDTYEIGMSANLLGAGREKITDPIDHSAGIVFFKKKGDKILKGEPLCEIHTNKSEITERAAEKIVNAIDVSGKCPRPAKLIYKTIR